MKDDFENLLDYQKWVNESMQRLDDKGSYEVARFSRYNTERLLRSENWFGEGVSFEELEKGITSYKKPELIEYLLNQVNDKITTETKDKIKNRKVKYNPNGLGVFVFDRAAMGMYQLNEFYSPSLKKVVDETLVKRINKGFILIEDGSKVIQRKEQLPNGKPKIRTSTKDVFAYYPKQEKERHAVEIYISCGGNASITAKQMLYSGISAIVVAEILQQARIQTKISVVFGSTPDDFDNVYACSVPIKQFDEPLDKNLLALLSSDPRFFRFDGFKGFVSIYDYFSQPVPKGLGKGLKADDLKAIFENSNYTKQLRQTNNRFYFGWIFNEEDAIKQINETIEQISHTITAK